MEERAIDSKTTFIAIIMMALVVILSNVLVQFYLGAFLTYGAFTYPIAFLINDVVNKLEGPRRARLVIFWGFVVLQNFCQFCSISVNILNILPVNLYFVAGDCRVRDQKRYFIRKE